jgi:hypothetical protein
MFKRWTPDPRIQRVGTWWHYEINQVLPGYENEINLADFDNAVIVPDQLSHAWRFLNADLNYALYIKPTPDGKITGFEDLVESSLHSFTDDNSTGEHVKQVYYLTENDKAQACEFLKLVLTYHIDTHTPEGQEDHARALKAEIAGISDLMTMKRKMAIYFDVQLHADWKREDLDAEKVHKVDYKFHGHHVKLSQTV